MKNQMNVSVWRDELARLRTNKKEFLEQMERLILWGEWKAIIEPHYYKLDSGKFLTKKVVALSAVIWYL